MPRDVLNLYDGLLPVWTSLVALHLDTDTLECLADHLAALLAEIELHAVHITEIVPAIKNLAEQTENLAVSHQHGVLHIDAHENLFHPLRNRNRSHFAAAPDLVTAQHLVPTLSLHPSNTPRPTHLHLHLHLLRHHPHLHPNLSGMPPPLAYQKGTQTTL